MNAQAVRRGHGFVPCFRHATRTRCRCGQAEHDERVRRGCAALARVLVWCFCEAEATAWSRLDGRTSPGPLNRAMAVARAMELGMIRVEVGR